MEREFDDVTSVVAVGVCLSIVGGSVVGACVVTGLTVCEADLTERKHALVLDEAGEDTAKGDTGIEE